MLDAVVDEPALQLQGYDFEQEYSKSHQDQKNLMEGARFYDILVYT
jgi:hypothetical protein